MPEDGSGRAHASRLDTPQLSWIPLGGTVSDNNSLSWLTCVWGRFHLLRRKGKNKVGDTWETNSSWQKQPELESLLAYGRPSRST